MSHAPDWQTLLTPSTDLTNAQNACDWFREIATRLLNETDFIVGGQTCRLTEIEFYYTSDQHPDPFTHHDPLQQQMGQWYFHRSRGTYRNGSFKGLDLSFGDGTTYGGIIFRGLELPDGALIDGPSLLVDYLLKATGHAKIKELDGEIDHRKIWDISSPVHLRDATAANSHPVYACGRVGLSLKKIEDKPEATKYILRSYRFLSEPSRIKKGKPYLLLGLAAQGHSVDEIQEITGAQRRTIERYLQDCEAGRSEDDFSAYIGKDLTPKLLCQLHGTWQRHS